MTWETVGDFQLKRYIDLESMSPVRLDAMKRQAANRIGADWNPGYLPEDGELVDIDEREWLVLDDTGLVWPIDQEPHIPDSPNPVVDIRAEFERLEMVEHQDFKVSPSIFGKDKVVICDNQSCGLYDAQKALRLLRFLVGRNTTDVWAHLESALIEDDVSDTYDVEE